MRPFVRITLTVDADLVIGREVVKKFQRKTKLISPERKLSKEFLQESLITSVAERLMDMLDEINYEHETSATPED